MEHGISNFENRAKITRVAHHTFYLKNRLRTIYFVFQSIKGKTNGVWVRSYRLEPT